MSEFLNCISCEKKYDISQVIYKCSCGGLISVNRPIEDLKKLNTDLFDKRLASRNPFDQSGVWRFREAVFSGAADQILSMPEGRTNLYQRERLGQWADCENIWFKHEGENPSGSFKDRGMTVAVTQAKRLGKKYIACASTGNTSASLAAYAALAACQALVFIPQGKISSGKLSQALAYGAKCLSIAGDFDRAMSLVREACDQLGIYLVNSLNPFRIEGQKTIIWDILQSFNWQAPDWIVTPAGNLGNTSAFGKAIKEAYEAGWIDKKPKIAAVQASGANPFYNAFNTKFMNLSPVKAQTVASAIQIGNPVNYPKAKFSINDTKGYVEEVSDEEILRAKYEIDRNAIGCEPASACSLAGVKKLRTKNLIKPDEKVVCILTGHLLKDTDTTVKNIEENAYNSIIEIDGELKDIQKVLL